MGQWLPGFNVRDLEPLRQSLAAGVPWNIDQNVMFAVNRTTVLECTWSTFLTYWNNFLYVESDAAMLLSTNHSHQCTLFRAIGDALFVAD